MRSWIIHFFGGFTYEELELKSKQVSLGAQLIHDRELDNYKSQIDVLRTDNQYLRDLILKKTGMVLGEIHKTSEGVKVPIKTSSSPWNRRREALEAKDREIARDLQKREAEWLAKGARPVDSNEVENADKI